jgi:hypothetical protein
MAKKDPSDTSDAPKPQLPDNEKHRVQGFHALLADHKESGHYYEERDGSPRTWPELSAEGKLSYIARDAAFYEVPFERFAEAARDVLSDQPPAAREEASLRLLYSADRELHEMAKLLPDDPGTTYPPPLADQLHSLLDRYEARLKELSAYEKIGAAFKEFAGDVARDSLRTKQDAAPAPDVFERNGHHSAQERPSPTDKSQAADQQPDPPRRR